MECAICFLEDFTLKLNKIIFITLRKDKMSTPYYDGGSQAMVSPYYLGKRRRVTNTTITSTPVVGLTNPLTSNLDAATFSFENVNETNNTLTPLFKNVGPISATATYAVAVISDETNAVGDISFHIRCLDASYRQLIYGECLALNGKANIRILNHLHESDTLCIVNVCYGLDSSNQGYLFFTCGTNSTTCEISIYQNQKNNSSLAQIFDTSVAGNTVTIPNILKQYSLSAFNSGTTGNFSILETATTKNLETNTVAANTTSDITFNNSLNVNNNNVDLVKTLTSTDVKTNGISSISGDIQFKSQIDVQNNVLYNSAGDYVNMNDNLDLKNHEIENLNGLKNTAGSEIQVHKNLNILSNNLVNVDDIQTNSISKASGVITVSNPVSLGANSIQSSWAPAAANDLTNKQYVDTAVASAGGLSNPLTVNLDLGTNQIVNLADGTNNTDASTVGQLNAAVQWESLTTNNISNKNSANVGIGVTNPVAKLDVDGDIQTNASVKSLKDETQNLEVHEVITVNNVVTESTGLNRFLSRGVSAANVYKRIAAFSHIFSTSAGYTVTVPDFIFEPNGTNFFYGGAAFKVKLSAMGYEDSATPSITGGIEYREIIVQVVSAPQPSGTMASWTHEIHNVNCAPSGLPFTSYIQLIQSDLANITNPASSIVKVNEEAKHGIIIYPEPTEVPGANGNRRLFIRGTIEAV